MRVRARSRIRVKSMDFRNRMDTGLKGVGGGVVATVDKLHIWFIHFRSLHTVVRHELIYQLPPCTHIILCLIIRLHVARAPVEFHDKY